MAYTIFYMRVLKAAIVPEFRLSRTTDLYLAKTASTLALWISFSAFDRELIFLQMITILINIKPLSAYTCDLVS